MEELDGIAEKAGRAFLVAAVVEGFLDQDLRGERWNARALELTDPNQREVVRAWAASRGGRIEEWAPDEARTVNLMALEARVQAADSDTALTMAERMLTPLVRALAYRQLRPGRIVAWIAHPVAGGSTHVRRTYTDPSKVYHLPAGDKWSPAADVETIADAIAASPTGVLFAGLFSDALADDSPDGMVVRLWSLVEALSRGFWVADKTRKAQLRMVERAMAHLGLGDGVLLGDAYQRRNAFLHEGVRGDPGQVEPIRGRLVPLVFEALGRGGFREIDPKSPPWQAGETQPVRRLIIPASSPRPMV